MSKYTQKTLKYLRKDLGLKAGIVERFIKCKPFGKRIDLFGIIDIIAIGPGVMVGVQSTSQAKKHEHTCAIKERAQDVNDWLASGAEYWLITWSKRLCIRADGSRGTAKRWHPTVVKYDPTLLA